jgi:transcriptional regulator with XRE-family HTH domain
MLIREAIGQVIRMNREEECLTLRGLSQRSGVSIAHISDIERGFKDCSSEVLEGLCISMRLSLEELLIEATQIVRMKESSNDQAA